MKVKSREQKPLRAAAFTLVVALCGLATAVISGLALVPRVRLVEVVTVVMGAIGAGAALVAAWVQFTEARKALRVRSEAVSSAPQQTANSAQDDTV